MIRPRLPLGRCICSSQPNPAQRCRRLALWPKRVHNGDGRRWRLCRRCTPLVHYHRRRPA